MMPNSFLMWFKFIKYEMTKAKPKKLFQKLKLSIVNGIYTSCSSNRIFFKYFFRKIKIILDVENCHWK